MTNLEQIRFALNFYLSDQAGLVGIPANLLSLLEDPDENARSLAESMEGVLALYAANRISKDSLKKQIVGLLATPENMVVITGTPLMIDKQFYSYTSGSSAMLRVGASVPVVPASIQIARGMEFELPYDLQR